MLYNQLHFPGTMAKVPAMTNIQENIQYCRTLVQDQDLDRYYLSLFAPDSVRMHMWAILAFNCEVSNIVGKVSEPMLAEIRLQWWREAFDSILESQPRKHPVVEQLANLPDFGRIRYHLDKVLDAWSIFHEEDRATVSALECHAENTGGSINVALLHVLSPNALSSDAGPVRQAGKVFSLLAGIRAVNRRETGGTDAKALQATLKRIGDKLKPELSEMRAIQFTTRTTSILMAANGISDLYLRDLERAKFNIDEISLDKPSRFRKLFALLKYHMFSK